jgi:hypothetical protein
MFGIELVITIFLVHEAPPLIRRKKMKRLALGVGTAGIILGRMPIVAMRLVQLYGILPHLHYRRGAMVLVMANE